jgi:hypothetical protein
MDSQAAASCTLDTLGAAGDDAQLWRPGWRGMRWRRGASPFALGRHLLQTLLAGQAVSKQFAVGQRRVMICDGEIALPDVKAEMFRGEPIIIGGAIPIAANPDKPIQY